VSISALNSSCSQARARIRPSLGSDLLFLDGLGGLAATYVMLGHSRWLLWEGYRDGYQKHLVSHTTLATIQICFVSLFKYRLEVVLFFFALSGFVIHLHNGRQVSPPGLSESWLRAGSL
jgi:peptidoglycan/LPS O-acetylase OafA/YrhL